MNRALFFLAVQRQVLFVPFKGINAGDIIQRSIVANYIRRCQVNVVIYAVQRVRVSGITFCSAEFAIQFTNRYFRVTFVIILYPFQLFICVCIGMLRERFVGSIKQRSFSTIEFFVPTHEGRFRYVISSANERNSNAGMIEFDGIIFSLNFMWQISL